MRKALGVAVLAAAGAGLAVAATAVGDTQGFHCTGSETVLFNNWNGDPVENGGTAPTFSTKGKTYCLVSIATYHWNGPPDNGQGERPGTIRLENLFTDEGPWQATGSPGQATMTHPNGVPNAGWTVNPGTPDKPVIINGTYQCEDSSHATWSQNAASDHHGFCKVWVRDATPTTPTTTGTTTPTKPPCDVTVQKGVEGNYVIKNHKDDFEASSDHYFRYRIDVKNVSECIARDVVLTDKLPVLFRCREYRLEKGGRHVPYQCPSEGAVVVDIGDLAPHQSASVVITGYSVRVDVMSNQATTTGKNSAAAKSDEVSVDVVSKEQFERDKKAHG